MVASGEFLSVLWAIAEADPGDVLVVQAGGGALAALGECSRPRPRGAGWAGSSSTATCATAAGAGGAAAVGARDGADGGSQRRRSARRRRDLFGGAARVARVTLVVADDDGIVIAPREGLEAYVAAGPREIESGRGGGARPATSGDGVSLIDMTNLRRARRGAAEPARTSSLGITPPA